MFTGYVNQRTLSDLYSVADIGVVPSLHEEFGYVAIEMMMHRLPVIVNATTGLAEDCRSRNERTARVSEKRKTQFEVFGRRTGQRHDQIVVQSGFACRIGTQRPQKIFIPVCDPAFQRENEISIPNFIK